MATKGRPPSAKTLVDKQLGRNVKHPVLPAGDSFVVPNHSGDHSEGRVDKTPDSDLDLVNKAYVDNEILTCWLKSLGQTGLTGDKSGSFNLTTTGEGGFGGLMPYDSATFDLGSVGLKWRNLILSGDITTLEDITATGTGTFGDLIVDTDTLFVDKTNNRVGVGTTTPGYILDIDAGEIGDGNYDGLRIIDTGWKASSYPMLEFYNSNVLFNGSLARIYGEIGNIGTNSKLYFAVADSSKSLQDRMVIDKDGNVGIGVVDPDSKLEVDGDINITGNLIANQIYGEMWYHNHTGTTINFVVQDTWYLLWFTNASELNGFSYVGEFNSSSNLTTQVAGLYLANYIASGNGQNNHIYFTTILINNVDAEQCGGHKKMAAGGDIITMSGTCFINLNIGDTISLATQDFGGTGTGEYFSANLNLVRIGNG